MENHYIQYHIHPLTRITNGDLLLRQWSVSIYNRFVLLHTNDALLRPPNTTVEPIIVYGWVHWWDLTTSDSGGNRDKEIGILQQLSNDDLIDHAQAFITQIAQGNRDQETWGKGASIQAAMGAKGCLHERILPWGWIWVPVAEEGSEAGHKRNEGIGEKARVCGVERSRSDGGKLSVDAFELMTVRCGRYKWQAEKSVHRRWDLA